MMTTDLFLFRAEPIPSSIFSVAIRAKIHSIRAKNYSVPYSDP